MGRNKLFATIIPLALMTATISANAADGTYFVASFGLMNNEVPGESFTTQNIFAKVGKEISPNFAVEGILGLGIASDKWTSANGCDSEEVSTDQFIGAQLVGSVPISPSVKFHGNLSLVQTTATIKIAGAASCYGVGLSESYSDSDTDLGYGVGIDYQLNQKSAITADYHFFYDDSYSGVDLTIGGLLIGYKQSF